MRDSQAAIPVRQSSSPQSGEAFKNEVIRAAVRAGLLSDDQLIASFVDRGAVARTVESLIAAFPENFRHTFAAKANSMRNALELVKLAGIGCEVSSPGELEQAIRVGFSSDQIVYDAPAKTQSIIDLVIGNSIGLNVDNFQEFDRVAAAMREHSSASRIGFRINPQVGAGKIGAMSTATSSSKFGVALDDAGNRQRLIDCYRSNPWLTSMHTHIGSQGCSLELMTAGIAKVVGLVEEINATIGRQQIVVIDIGGGLPVNFNSAEVTPTFAEYAAALRDKVPSLFDADFTVKTEFGRSIFAKSGFIAARVEYTKNSGGRQIAITHAGAQIAARTAFMPDLWAIRIGVYDANGSPKTGETVIQDVAGPCCFAGDVIAHARALPLIEPGDIVVLHDTGAYYFSNPFFYNCLPASGVYGAVSGDSNNILFDVWREPQSLDNLLSVLG